MRFRARLLVSAAAIAWACAGAARAAEPRSTLLAAIERFDALTVGEAVTVSGVRLEGPHASMTLETGRAAPVKAGEAVVGVFFEGRGALDYLSADALEAPVVVFNAKKGSGIKPEKTAEGVRLKDGFKRVLFLAAGRAPACPRGSRRCLARGRLPQAPREVRPHARPAALARLRASASRRARNAAALGRDLRRGRDDLLYVFDGTDDDPGEGLATLNASESNESELRKYLWLAPLSLQPVGRDPRDPPRPALSPDRRRPEAHGHGGQRRVAHGRRDARPAGPGARRDALRRRLDRLRDGGREPGGPLGTRAQGDRRERPRAGLRSPHGRARRGPCRAGAGGQAL